MTHYPSSHGIWSRVEGHRCQWLIVLPWVNAVMEVLTKCARQRRAQKRHLTKTKGLEREAEGLGRALLAKGGTLVKAKKGKNLEELLACFVTEWRETDEMRLEEWLGPDEKGVNCPIKKFLLYMCRYHVIAFYRPRGWFSMWMAEVAAYGLKGGKVEQSRNL